MNRSFILFILTSIICQRLALRAPEITVQPIDYIDSYAISPCHDEHVVVPCIAIGEGNVTYAWKHNGQNIQFDSRVRLSGGNLTFYDIDLADAGKYPA